MTTSKVLKCGLKNIEFTAIINVKNQLDKPKAASWFEKQTKHVNNQREFPYS